MNSMIKMLATGTVLLSLGQVSIAAASEGECVMQQSSNSTLKGVLMALEPFKTDTRSKSQSTACVRSEGGSTLDAARTRLQN